MAQGRVQGEHEDPFLFGVREHDTADAFNNGSYWYDFDGWLQFVRGTEYVLSGCLLQ